MVNHHHVKPSRKFAINLAYINASFIKHIDSMIKKLKSQPLLALLTSEGAHVCDHKEECAHLEIEIENHK